MQASAASVGQPTWSAVAPRRSSMRMAAALPAAGNCTGTKAVAAVFIATALVDPANALN